MWFFFRKSALIWQFTARTNQFFLQKHFKNIILGMFGISFSIRWLNFFLATCARGQFFRGFSFCLLSSSKFSPFPIRFYAICSNAWSKPVGIDDIVLHTHPKKLFQSFQMSSFFQNICYCDIFRKIILPFCLKVSGNSEFALKKRRIRKMVEEAERTFISGSFNSLSHHCQ